MRVSLCSMFALCMIGGAAYAAPHYQDELIFPIQGKHVHGSSIVQLPNGDFLACWFYGSGERSANDVQIQGARLKKGAKQWGAVFTMADTPGLPDCNPVVFIDSKKRLWLFWLVVRANRWEHGILKYRRADDYQGSGVPNWNWQEIIVPMLGDELPEQLEKGFKDLGYDQPMWAEYAPQYTKMIVEAAKDKAKRQEGWMTRIHPLALASGRILLPLYSDGFNVSLVCYSDDLGDSWNASAPIIGLGPIQPTLVQKKDGTVVAYMRDSGVDPSRVMSGTSTDEGKTWSLALDTGIPNPGSSLETIALKDGRWVMIFNDTEQGRHSLALALSVDEGQSWAKIRHLELAPMGQGGFAYPSLMQSKDGKIHATYSYSGTGGKSIKHVALDTQWIEAGD